ncbi:MAG: hypothetical protein QOF12_682 [Solirubrobacteraceae bacterium]|nr:hypothetical protein [Solirubrobacteraceae bacterium]
MWRKVLDPRLYRAAFVPLLLVLVVAAFSLVDRPRPLQTTLAPDAFDGTRALATLQGLAAQAPVRRPGDAGDQRLARVVEKAFRSAFCPHTGVASACSAVSVRDISGHTIDGERDLETVVATRLGRPGPGIVVIAHRDAAGRGAQAELSGTAALLELARVFSGRSTRRTLTLVSTSGGSGGAAGAAQLAGALPTGDPHPDAVLVLGDVASLHARHPWVQPWSTGASLAPVQLRRTVETALRQEAGGDGGARAITQLARLAFPFGLGEEAPFNDAGIPAVELQASGERGPPASAPVSAARLRGFGRGALRAIDALDAGPGLRDGPSAQVLVLNKVLPPWVVRLLVGVLLLPMLVAAIDGLARVRRRKAMVAPWLRWLTGLGLPFLAAVLVARLLGLTGLLADAPGEAVAAGRVPVDGVALAFVILVFVLGVVAVRPLHRRLAVQADPHDGGGPAALTLTTTALAVVVWLINPFAAAVLVAPAHLWMLATVPETRPRRPIAVALVVLALAPAALVLAVFAAATGASLPVLPWTLLLLVAGGQLGPLSLLALCVLGACAVGALRLALRPPAQDAAPASAQSVRGPLGYAGPGSLGGTDSAMRVRR